MRIVVRADWLKALTGYFIDPKVAVVQCPQAHRDWEHNAFRRMTILGVRRWASSASACIIATNAMRSFQHGHDDDGPTRCTRKRPPPGANWTICEDAELGLLRLMHAGYDTIYV